MRKNPRTARHSRGIERISKYLVQPTKYCMSGCGENFLQLECDQIFIFSRGMTEQRLSRLINTTRWSLQIIRVNIKRASLSSFFASREIFLFVHQPSSIHLNFPKHSLLSFVPSPALFHIFRIGATRERDKRKIDRRRKRQGSPLFWSMEYRSRDFASRGNWFHPFNFPCQSLFVYLLPDAFRWIIEQIYCQRVTRSSLCSPSLLTRTITYDSQFHSPYERERSFSAENNR